MTVLDEVLAERRRQIEVLGWTPAHDDKHSDHELVWAAICYCHSGHGEGGREAPGYWPWSLQSWKPKTRREDLVRAAALIVAEVERLDRASAVQAVRKAEA